MQKDFYEKEAYNMNISGNHRFHDSNENYKKILLKPIYDDQNMFNGEYAMDFGCGQGRNVSNLILWFPSLFKRVDGVDISESNIEYCWGNLKNEVNDSEKYNFYVNNGYDLSAMESDFYKFTMSTITLQHICVHETRISLMKEIYRIMKKGGVFSFQMGYSKEIGSIRVGYYDNKYDATATNGACDVEVTDEQFLIEDLRNIGFVDIEFDIVDSFQGDHDKWIYVRCKK